MVDVNCDDEWKKTGGKRRWLMLGAAPLALALPVLLLADHFEGARATAVSVSSALATAAVEKTRIAISFASDLGAQIIGDASGAQDRVASAEEVIRGIESQGMGEPAGRLVSAGPVPSVSTTGIPRAVPDMSGASTVGDAMHADAAETQNLPVSGYVLGEDGASEEIRAAFELVRSAAVGEISQMEDDEIAARAAARIGYVPAGVDPVDIRVPGGSISGSGQRVVTGIASVIDGQMISVGEEVISLQGVRAPGEGEICTGPAGGEYDCMAWSLEGMEYLAKDRELECAVTDETHENGGAIGWCNISGTSSDFAGIAVRSGILFAVPGEMGISPYDEDEDDAKAAARGLWSGSVTQAQATPAAGQETPEQLTEYRIGNSE